MQETKHQITNVAEFEALAASIADRDAWRYFKGGAEREVTLKDNQQAFDRIRLRPRVLMGTVDSPDLSTTILGAKIKRPVGIAPTAYHRLVWPDGELSTARAAEELGVCFTLSTASTTGMRSVTEQAPAGLKWFQLYILKDRELTKKIVSQAEHLGMKALVVTVDAPVLGSRWHIKGRPLKFPPGVKYELFDEMVFGNTEPDHKGAGKIVQFAECYLSWKDISWLKSITSLPVVVKGILTREDAILAIEHGVNAIWVSNHGGRQLDGVLATVDALPEVVDAVDGRVEVYVDGGVRTGTDVLKALALGARAVFIGLPVIWGLAVNGTQGVKDIFNILHDELITAMKLSGCRSLSTIKKSLIHADKIPAKL